MISLPFETEQRIIISSLDIDGAPYTGSILYSFVPDGTRGDLQVWQSPTSFNGQPCFYAGPFEAPCVMHLYVQAQGPSPQLPVVDAGRVEFY